jgi:hypothetical protein
MTITTTVSRVPGAASSGRPSNAIGICAAITCSAGAGVCLTQYTTHCSRAVVEITIGPDPESMLLQVAGEVLHSGLKSLITQFLFEPEIRELLTVIKVEPGRSYKRITLPIQLLRRAAELAQYWGAFGPQERDVLYVATLLQGCQTLLKPTLTGFATPQDVMFTIVRPALHRLEDQFPRQAFLLRLCLGWGNLDEGDDYYLHRLQQSIDRALSIVHIGSAAVKPNWPAAYPLVAGVNAVELEA